MPPHINVASGPPGPSERVPLLTSRRLEMFRALEDNPSYYELSSMLPALADDIETLGQDLSATAAAAAQIRADPTQNRREMCVLLHAIPKDLLRSLILGTVAFDFSQSPKPASYAVDGPGAYVAAMTISGRSGKWLSRNEIAELIQKLDKYVAAYEAWKTHCGQPKGAIDTDLDSYAKMVDSQYGARDANKTEELRFANDDAVAKIRPFTSSPLYVGCSKDMGTLTTAFDPNNGLGDTNKLWSLVCSVLQFIGKTPLVVVVPVIRTWTREQLPLAEILTTALASSLVTQDGFNIHGPGTTLDGGTMVVLKEAETYVLALQDHLKDNVEATTKEINSMKAYGEKLELLSRFPSPEIERSLEELQKLQQNVFAALSEYDDLVAKVQAEAAELQRQTRDVEQYRDYLRQTKSIFEIILGPPDDDDALDNDGTSPPDE
ncbi:hypothetical protein F4677DRAFT_445903 [Hypoxylon crocopeplum]|nr:hypothetical protein F4677DRAFT_445903 [Hypoxylon crocopeplum]